RASSFMSLHPVFGAALGMIFFDEAFRPYHVLGTAVILLGVWLVSRTYRQAATA
ncbi:MAG: EamA family transporter, partial [Rhodospirillales bacterium]